MAVNPDISGTGHRRPPLDDRRRRALYNHLLGSGDPHVDSYADIDGSRQGGNAGDNSCNQKFVQFHGIRW
jgi:hypothetical protein